MSQQNETKTKPAEPDYQRVVEKISVPLPGGGVCLQQRVYWVQRRH